jgi:hypothetical protein
MIYDFIDFSDGLVNLEHLGFEIILFGGQCFDVLGLVVGSHWKMTLQFESGDRDDEETYYYELLGGGHVKIKLLDLCYEL